MLACWPRVMADGLGHIGVIVAARTGSTRLPGKVLQPLGGQPLILFLLRRIAAGRQADSVLLATTDLPDDDELAETVEAAGFPVFRGAQNDVVRRYVEAAAVYGFDHVVRVTGDCPFVDAESLDYCIEQVRALAPFDLATTKGRFPVGIDYEIYPTALMAALDESGLLDAKDREHLTVHLYRQRKQYRLVELEPPKQWRSAKSFTVDTPQDFARAQALVAALSGSSFSIESLMRVSN